MPKMNNLKKNVPKSKNTTTGKALGPKVVNAPTAQSNRQTATAPQTQQVPGGVRIRHSELLGSVLGSVAFTANRYVLNPGNSTTFPWLAPQAIQYERYKFRNLRFRYITRTATTTVGSVLLVPEYNALAPSPATEIVAANYQGSVEDVPWRSIDMVMDPAKMTPGGVPKFVRHNDEQTAQDLKTYDSGLAFICTVEEVGTDAIGKLYVDYDVDLLTPQLETALASAIRGSYWTSSGQTLTSTVQALLNISTASVVAPALNLTNTGGTVTLHKGAYQLLAQVSCKDSSAESFTSEIGFLKNGSTIIARLLPIDTVAANAIRVTYLHALFVAAEGDTIGVYATFTGAAGTLTTTAQTSLMILTV